MVGLGESGADIVREVSEAPNRNGAVGFSPLGPWRKRLGVLGVSVFFFFFLRGRKVKDFLFSMGDGCFRPEREDPEVLLYLSSCFAFS